ncbi:related to oxidase [Rhynchosporium agropyri]|uniref:Related to oxidase n=1 Tax=Rhynchosporium agropyri TaxID=914238 RepID=A0A1E1K483_9HELO|nr:related to oxidase [Rhynchosporium agropyri]
MKYFYSILFSAATVAAFPSYWAEQLNRAQPGVFESEHFKRAIENLRENRAVEETNCGPVPCAVFNAKEQLVSIEGEHAFMAPVKGKDLRGPCPGLNAAANHGYIPHNGVLDSQQTINGLANAYGMGPDLALGLAAVAVLFDGDITKLEWSIGGPQNVGLLQAGVFGRPRGLSFSHNNYEGDASIGRPDYFLNNGNAYSLDINRFKKAYEKGMADDRYTIDKFRDLFVENINYSIQNNPHYFSSQFAGLIVVPAAYNFVVNFMSNHTAEEPSGAIFKEFFSVTGDYPNFNWIPGHEKIPANWYRRTSTNPYSLPAALLDVAGGWVRDPSAFRLGGNVNGVNTYTGVSLGDLSGGLYNAGDLAKGNNLGCFAFQLQTMYLETNLGLSGLLPNGILGVQQLIAKAVTPLLKKLSCPEVANKQFDFTIFDRFPGAKDVVKM